MPFFFVHYSTDNFMSILCVVFVHSPDSVNEETSKRWCILANHPPKVEERIKVCVCVMVSIVAWTMCTHAFRGGALCRIFQHYRTSLPGALASVRHFAALRTHACIQFASYVRAAVHED